MNGVRRNCLSLITRTLPPRVVGLLPILLIVLAGCPSTQQTRTSEGTLPPRPAAKKPAAPDIVIQFASIDLSTYAKRIERRDIENLAAVLRHEKIDVLALQGITRYPGLASRIDPVDELAARAEMRVVFGETISISGQQHGNAVFSVYPIRSSENTHYEGIQSSGFEAALQAIIDCGIRDAVFISTELPIGNLPTERSACLGMLGTFNDLYVNKPIVISGNLPSSSSQSALAAYDALQGSRPKDAPEVWYSNNGSLKPLPMRVEKTAFGPLLILPLGIFGQPQH